jgi:hypothetical protein
MQEVEGFVEYLTASGVAVPRYGLNNCLCIPRKALVGRIIKMVERDEEHNVYIFGAAGMGKTVLLELIAIQLKAEGKKSIIVLHANDFNDCYDEISLETNSLNEPLYVLVDEAHTASEDSVWKYLKGAKKPFYTIAAGIPGKASTSSKFNQHIDVNEMFLTLDDIMSNDVVQFYTDRFIAALLENEIPTTDVDDAREIVRNVLAFTHKFTNGHSFPCLKMVEFFVTKEFNLCRDALDLDISLTKSITCAEFDSVFLMIYNRCYRAIESLMFEQLLSTWSADGVASFTVLTSLSRFGLWSYEENRSISLLLHHVIVKKWGFLQQRIQQEVGYYDNFGNALAYALKSLTSNNKCHVIHYH